MRSITITTLIAMTISATAFSSSFGVSDPFTGSSCANTTCDVIGATQTYDIQKGTFSTTGTSGQFDIFTNFANSTLTPFSDGNGANLYIGDLLFTVNGVVKYGVALTTHSETGNPGAATGGTNVVAGTLYQVLSVANGVETSTQAMGSSTDIYRPNTNVWLRNYSGALSSLAAGTVSVIANGNGSTTGALYDIRVGFNNDLTTGFVNDFSAANFGVSFASAICANDIMTGTNTPEPVTMGLIGAGLVGMGLLRRFKK